MSSNQTEIIHTICEINPKLTSSKCLISPAFTLHHFLSHSPSLFLFLPLQDTNTPLHTAQFSTHTKTYPPSNPQTRTHSHTWGSRLDKCSPGCRSIHLLHWSCEHTNKRCTFELVFLQASDFIHFIQDIKLSIYLSIYLCVCVCMYACMHVCVCVYIYILLLLIIIHLTLYFVLYCH